MIPPNQPENDMLLDAMGITPMFGGAGPIPYTGPFNFGAAGAGGNMLSMLGMFGGPLLMQLLGGGTRMTPAQFFPTQSYYDQLRARDFLMQSFRARQIASLRDRQQLAATITGAMHLMYGRPLTAVERQQAFQLAGTMEGLMPTMSMLLGPDTIDTLYGSRGSAMLFAEAVHRAGRLMPDPVTGSWGIRSRTAGIMSSELFERLYGPRADIGQMRGIGAGALGSLFEEMAVRGFMVPSLGQLPARDMAAAIAQLDLAGRPDMLARAARHLQETQPSGLGMPPGAMERVISETQQSIRAAYRTGDTRQILDAMRLPGADILATVANADRVAAHLRKMTGVVNAMRDIFGDMGKPNAPMRELINGLNALTQGGLAYMRPEDLERSVRMFKAVARQTGIGLQGLMGLSAQVASVADARGVNRAFVPEIAKQAAMFGAAFGVTNPGDIPAWGAYTKEEATIKDSQLRTQAAGSDVANRINALLRMRDMGLLRGNTPGAQRVRALADAIAAGEPLPAGVDLSAGGWQRMLAEAGVAAATVQSIQRDVEGNQEYGARYDTTTAVRNLQWSQQLAPMTAQALTHIFMGGAQQSTAFRRAIGRLGDAGRQQLFYNISQGLLTHMQAAPDRMRTARERQPYIREGLKQQIVQQLVASGVSEAQANQVVREMEQSGQLAQMATSIEAEGNVVAGQMGYKSLYGMIQMHAQPTLRQQARLRSELTTEAEMESALSGLGRASPLRRLVNAIRNATPNTSWRDVVGEVMGGVPLEAEMAANPQFAMIGRIVQAFDTAERDEQGNLTEAGIRQRAEASKTITAIVEGGEAAQEWLNAAAQQRGIRIDPRVEAQYQQEVARIMASDAAPADKKKQLAALRRRFSRSRDAQLERAFAKAATTPEGQLAADQFQAVLAASHGQSATAELERLGISVGQTVGPEDAEYVARQSRNLTKILEESAGAPPEKQQQALQEAKTAAAQFIAGARRLYTDVLSDDIAMERMGRGGLSRIQARREKLAKLEQLAAEASKAKGERVTVVDLLTGQGPAEQVAAARQLQTEIQADVAALGQEINPLEPKDKTKGKKPRTDQEREELIEVREALAREQALASAPPEAREQYYQESAQTASKQLQQMAASAGITLAGMEVDDLVKQMARRGTGTQVSQALRAREKLMKRIKGDQRFKGLSEQAAIDQLIKTAPAEEQEDLRRWATQAQPFLGLPQGAGGAAELSRRLQQFASQREETPAEQAGKEMKITGTVTIKNMNEALLSLTPVDLGSDGASFPPSGLA